ncbi:MAG: ATP-dependent helicase HrpB [Gemmatimonadota bacterium]
MPSRPAPLADLPPLPIDAVMGRIVAALEHQGAAVVVAPPGAGKTTRIPLALLDSPWRGEGRILVLEPRRLASRAAATQMARLLGEPVGQTVGYRVRHDSRVSARTRIEVVTEGILTRMVQEDPGLDGVAALCFDEFHERHLTTDLGLALALESRAVLREDLRLVVMSATLDPAPIAAQLGDAPVIVSEGRAFPVETSWRPVREGIALPLAVAQAIREHWTLVDGDCLVFLPGIAEIRRTEQAIIESPPSGPHLVQILHGSLALEEQDAVLRPRGAVRRIILSTAIAESSVTLEGVRMVVDAGRSRVPRFDPRSGMTRLATVKVSQQSADQRRGRAGRVAPGLCVRLWSEGEHASLPVRAVPEILESDLTALALELACAGITDAGALRWMDAPPAGALARGRALLADLGALDAVGRVTAHGRAMAALGVTPRLAHLVLAGAARGEGRLACEIAALLAERDVLRREAADLDPDLTTRVESLRGMHRESVDGARLERVRAEVRLLQRELPRDASAVRARDEAIDPILVGELVALAYPDRGAARRWGEGARYLLRNGRGARLERPGHLARAPFLAIADIDGDPAESRIWLAAPLDEAALRRAGAAGIVTERAVAWDATLQQIRATERETLGAIVLKERPRTDVTDEEIVSVWLDAVRREGITLLPWNEKATKLRERLAFAHAIDPAAYPDVGDATLLDALEDWLAQVLVGVRRLSDLTRVDLAAALLDRLPWPARARLDLLAPMHLEVPSGSRILIDYADPSAPVLAVRLQEVFGWTETPRIGEGRVPLTLHLLSPAHRPVQVTKDLAGFWRSTYFEVRKDLRGRYPRHPWPEDPLSAPATKRAKPRGT